MQVKNDAHIGQEITIFYFNLHGGTQITGVSCDDSKSNDLFANFLLEI